MTKEPEPRRVRAAAAGGRARILQVARAAFVERGYADASMQDIADAAGLTKAAIYYHFADKQELFEAVVIAEMERLHHGVVQQLAPESSFRAQLERFAAYALGTDIGARRRLHDDVHRYCDPARVRALKSHMATPFSLLRGAFAAAQARGEIGACNIDLVMTLFLNMIEGQVKGADAGSGMDCTPPELARVIVNVLMDGIGAPPGASSAPAAPTA